MNLSVRPHSQEPLPHARSDRAWSAQADNTCLGPSALFPIDVAELSLVELQVLHSRLTRQLDSEYRTDPAGPHPLTIDRHHEVVLVLDAHTGT